MQHNFFIEVIVCSSQYMWSGYTVWCDVH